MFQYSEAVLIGPVVNHSAQEENGDVLLLRRLWVKEAVALGIECRSTALGRYRRTKIDEPWNFTRPDSSASGMFFSQNCHPYVVRYIPYSERSGNSIHIPRLHPL